MIRFLLAVILALSPCASLAQTFGSPTYGISSYKYTNITTNTTTTVKSSAGTLHAICINTTAATGTITLYDNTAASGTKIGTITMTASPPSQCITYDVYFATGLTIVTAVAAGDLTIAVY